jgi:RNA polymerase sigma factor (sigma-70 family)
MQMQMDKIGVRHGDNLPPNRIFEQDGDVHNASRANFLFAFRDGRSCNECMDSDDMALVREFAASQSEPAFAQLVARHLDFVYSSALRRTGDAQLAEEVAQVVFIILARKAGKLGAGTVLTGWLYRATQYVATATLRQARRRQQREQEAYMQSTLNPPEADETWKQIAPLLEAALDKLNTRDRDAVLLRFFQDKTLAEVGAALGVSEDGARVRVNRALDKLRKLFARRGVDSTADAITGAISGNSVQIAPATLAKTVTAVAIAKGGAAASTSTLTLVKGALKIMAWTKAKTAIVASTCVLLAAGTATTLSIYEMGAPMRNVQSEWSTISGNEGQWTFTGGRIEAHTINGDSILASREKYGDVTFSAVAKTVNREASLAFRMQDAANGYILNFVPVGSPGEPNGFVRLRKRVGNDETTLAFYQGPRLAATGRSAEIKVVAKGPLITVLLNGANVLRVHDTTFTSGSIGLRVYGWEDSPCDATFSSVKFD